MTVECDKVKANIDMETFLIRQKEFTQQFSQIYYQRLMTLRPLIHADCQEIYEGAANKTASYVPRLVDLEEGSPSYIIGTIYRDMANKPNVLKELAEDCEIHPEKTTTRTDKYTNGTEDACLLEDESGRIKLSTGSIPSACLVTGMVVGVMGHENSEGIFLVKDIHYPELPPQPSLPCPRPHSTKRYVAFLSGLGLGGLEDHPRAQLTVDLVLDSLLHLHNSLPNGILVRVILAGNAFGVTSPEQSPKESVTAASTTTTRLTKDRYRTELTALRTLDALLEPLVRHVPVDILPGSTDLVNAAWPQQPILPSLLTCSSQTNHLSTCTNPYAATLDDAFLFLGTSGQNIDDLCKYVPDEPNRLSLAELTLRSAHLAPTAPDTLWCYPFYTKDPFVLTQTPHVYFIGNQPAFETKLVTGRQGQSVRIILIPSVVITGTVVLLCLDTMEVSTVQVDLFSFEKQV